MSAAFAATSLGPLCAIVLSNAILVFALSLFRSWGFDGIQQLMLLALSNLFLIAPWLLARKPAGRVPTTSAERLCVVAWSASYAVNYGLFAFFPDTIRVSDFMLGESVGPFLAALLWRSDRKSISAVLLALGPLAIALLIIASTSAGSAPRDAWGWVFPAIISVGFAVSLTAARTLSRTRDANWLCPRLGLANACGAVSIGVAVSLSEMPAIAPDWMSMISIATAGKAAIFACAAYLAQRFLLVGLRGANVWISAMLLATTVPMSIAVDHIVFGNHATGAALALSALYIAVASTATWGLRRNSPT